jgi:Mg-chelatase subunit ChlD
MWKNFQESLTSILDVKRNGLDDYNFNAKQSDEHSNGVYLSLINYLNGTLIADYNMFVQYAAGDGHFAMKAMKYFPGMVVGTKPEKITLAIQPFKDIPRVGVVVEKQKTAIPRPAFNSLSNYVEFVNETWRQTRILQMVLGSFSSSAAYFRTLDSFDKRAGLSFDYKNFKLPLSSYQKTLADSKDLSPAIAKSLNDQSTVLLNILGEMDDLCASLAVETQEKKYEQDHLDRVYEILERHKKLFEVWDERKELLYGDVRRVYDAYPPALATDSWYVSGKVLRDLTDLDHDALFLAKGHYQEGKPDVVSTEKIDDALREVIAREYDNMKGIKKFGRNNGLCPYTPYEDLPLTSKSLSEALKQLKPVVNATRNSHPYHKMVYHYNDIVDDYNKFCELSQQVHHLKTIKQPELYSFSPAPPVGKKQAETAASVKTPDVERQPAEYNLPQEQLAVKPVAKTAVLHDTVYIERRDTVYLSEPGEDLHSMEGYAINNMILLLDISGSMNAPEKLPLLKQSVLELLNMMRQEDQISIIAFSGKPKALLTASSFKDESRIKQAIQNLKPSGKTDGNAAVKLAYKVADENYVRAGNNRIILATDGEFAMNDETRELIGHYAREDIFLSVFNFGKGAGSGRALEQVAHLGKGNYSVISPENVEMRLIREAKSKKQK